MRIERPFPPKIYFPNSVVFDGTTASPSSYTDLDLSDVVSATSALVLLSAYRGANDCGYVRFRKNGETRLVNTFGVSAGDLNTQNGISYFICLTDTSGILEWISAVAVTGVVITVEAYIRV